MRGSKPAALAEDKGCWPRDETTLIDTGIVPRRSPGAGRQVRELRALADASRIISSVLDQDQLLQELFEQVTRIAPAYFYLIVLYDDENNVVSIEINVDEGVPYPREQYELHCGLLRLVILNRQPLRFESLAEDASDLDIDLVQLGSSKVNQGWLGVPMLHGDDVLDAIVVGSYRQGTFEEGHQQTLSSIASQAGVALQNARLYQQAKQLAVFEERQRLSRELHDAVTQSLFSASLISETVSQIWDSDQDEERRLLIEPRQLTRGALAEMRTLLLELRPAAIAETSLAELLRQLAEATTGRVGVPVGVHAQGKCAPPFDVHVALYRIAQEALNNVIKHAEAGQVEVGLNCTGTSRTLQTVELSVCDDGRGFDPGRVPPHRLGLGIIHERAQSIGAELAITSRLGEGTQVIASWEGKGRRL